MKQVQKKAPVGAYMKVVLLQFAECKCEPDDRLARAVEAYLFGDEPLGVLPVLQGHEEMLKFLAAIKQLYCLENAAQMLTHFEGLQKDLRTVMHQYENGNLLDKISIEEALGKVHRISAEINAPQQPRRSQLRLMAQGERKPAPRKSPTAQKKAPKHEANRHVSAQA